MKVLFLTKYGRMGASSRLRTLQYIPFFESQGFSCTVAPLLPDEMLMARYGQGTYSKKSLMEAYARRASLLLRKKKFDLIWVEKESLPWVPSFVESALLSGVPYVMDFDDAIFHNYDLHRLAAVRSLFGKRLDRLMKKSKLVIAGNNYLAQRALNAGAQWVEKVPTVIDLDRYWLKDDVSKTTPPSIVWIGSPSTAKYLAALHEPLKRLQHEIPSLTGHPLEFAVIGAPDFSMPNVHIKNVEWIEKTEVDSLRFRSLGVMPLKDTPWEQGKCGYKLIQYMACGLPVVASPVGANKEIVQPGAQGFFAETSEEWIESIRKLLVSTELRQSMGQAGRRLVEDRYCLQKTGPQLVELLKKAAI